MERDANWDKRGEIFQKISLMITKNMSYQLITELNKIICRSAQKNRPGIGKESGSLMLGPKYNWQWGKIIVQCLKIHSLINQ